MRISDWSSDVCSSDLVLRGPQGTLFGRNTTGGAINIISKDPTDRFEGEVSGKVGNRANKEIGAIVNIPLAEGLAARATYNFRNISDGAGTNRALNRPLANVKSHRSEEHTSELQSLMRISYAVFCLKKKKYEI